jgi:hypothetical protein
MFNDSINRFLQRLTLTASIVVLYAPIVVAQEQPNVPLPPDIPHLNQNNQQRSYAQQNTDAPPPVAQQEQAAKQGVDQAAQEKKIADLQKQVDELKQQVGGQQSQATPTKGKKAAQAFGRYMQDVRQRQQMYWMTHPTVTINSQMPLPPYPATHLLSAPVGEAHIMPGPAQYQPQPMMPYSPPFTAGPPPRIPGPAIIQSLGGGNYAVYQH